MRLLEPFTLFSSEECRSLIASVQNLEPAGVYGAGRKLSVRNNHVFWYTLPQELKDRLWTMALVFREEYPWTWFQEPVQISSYGAGEFYDWHDDVISGRTSRRCLTLTCSLQSAPDARFETKDHSWLLESGQAVFFPSDMLHRATAPTSGVRWAFTVWYMQPNF